jgi:methylase of polypeptide subunit release factors
LYTSNGNGDGPAAVAVALQEVAAPHVPAAWLPTEQQFISVREWFGLQSAARWFDKGVQYQQLEHMIHPHPGCYFAVPTSRWVSFHFEVFQEWIDTTSALHNIEKVVEVGTGCGVLSFMLLQSAAGPIEVTAVDVNPAAVLTVDTNARRLQLGAADGGSKTVAAELANLVPTRFKEELDLVVFNPPWFPVEASPPGAPAAAGNGVAAPGTTGTAGRVAVAAANALSMDHADREPSGLPNSSAADWLDKASPYLRSVLDGNHWLEAASYRDHGLMEHFFDSAHAALKVGGRVVVVYCNYAQLVGKEESSGPIASELAASGRFKQQALFRRPVPLSRKTMEGKERSWKTDLLKELEIEVWVLEKTTT